MLLLKDQIDWFKNFDEQFRDEGILCNEIAGSFSLDLREEIFSQAHLNYSRLSQTLKITSENVSLN